jgi:hypothetical protein
MAHTPFENRQPKKLLVSDVYSSSAAAIGMLGQEHYHDLVDMLLVPDGVPGLLSAARNANGSKMPITLRNVKMLVDLHNITGIVLVDATRVDQHPDHMHAGLKTAACWLKRAFAERNMVVDSWVVEITGEHVVFQQVSFTCDGEGDCATCRSLAA